MSFRATVLRRSGLACIIFAFCVSSVAFGQAANSPVAFVSQDAITSALTDPPIVAGSSYSSGAGNSTTSTQWLKVEIHFGTTPNLTTDFLDSLDIKVWIEARDPSVINTSGSKGAAIALTGSVTYINIAAAKDVYGVFYVHPSTLARYAGDGGLDNFDRKYDIHAELYVKGALMDAIDKGKETDPKWFSALKPVPNLVYRQDQSPFVVSDVSRYPAIKLPAAAQ